MTCGMQPEGILWNYNHPLGSTMSSETIVREGRIGELVAGFSGPEASIPKILFLHGVMSRGRHFINYLEFFGSRCWSCCAVSYRGRDGIGPEGTAGVRYEDYLDDARAAARHLRA